MLCGGRGCDGDHSSWEKAVLHSAGSQFDDPESFAQWEEDEQFVTWVGGVFDDAARLLVWSASIEEFFSPVA